MGVNEQHLVSFFLEIYATSFSWLPINEFSGIAP